MDEDLDKEKRKRNNTKVLDETREKLIAHSASVLKGKALKAI